MRKEKDITGQKFGMLTALKRIESNTHYPVWNFRCECGKFKTGMKYNVTYGGTKSCGCMRKSQIHQKRLQELPGKVFGKLTVLGPAKDRYKKHCKGGKQLVRMWKCYCSCGFLTVVEEHSLLRSTRSCGCLIKETVTTHGLSYSVFFKKYMAMRQRLQKTNDSIPWANFQSFVDDTYESYQTQVKKQGKRIGIYPLDIQKPLSRNNWQWIDPSKTLGPSNGMNGNRIVIQKYSLNLAGWGVVLNLTRERTRQLNNQNKLIPRVEDFLETHPDVCGKLPLA